MIFKELPMLPAFVLILSGTAAAALSAWNLSAKRKVYGAAEFSLFLLSVSIYCFGYALEINQHTLSGMYDSLRIQFLGIPFTAVFFLIFTIKLTTGKKIKYYFYCLLYAVPVITVFLVFTVENHDLFYTDSSVVSAGVFPVLLYSAGPWYVVNIVNLIASSVSAEIILFISTFRTTALRRKQFILVFLSGLLPLISAVINPVRINNFDLQPFFLTITGIILSIAIFRYRMFDLVPYAREIAVDSIKEYMIVFDVQGHVQDLNLSADKSEMFKNVVTGALLPEKSLLRRFADSSVQHMGDYPENMEYQFDYADRNYLLKISFIAKKKRADSGFVFIISDITKSVKIIKELEYYAIYDSLTGIFNRRHILNLSIRELNIAEKNRQSVGIILMDIDYFKRINDNYGHQAGDSVLIDIAEILSSELRVSDIYGRYGGEEFLILCPGSDAETTFSIAERLRTAVEKHETVYENMHLETTASYGVYSNTPSRDENIDELLKKADIALYTAKNKGRNRTELFPD